MQKEKILKSPAGPGVYIFIDDTGPIYVGKATNIRARLLSHFNSAKLDRKEKLITEKAIKVKYFKTDSDFRALLLEARLINLYKPRYNLRGQDDKSNLYIQIDVKKDFPKIETVRLTNLNKKNKYFGPFSSQKVVLEIIRYLRKIVPFCTQKKITKRPCFYSKIGLCAPCPNYISSLSDKKEYKKQKKIYRQNVAQIIRILEGRNKQVFADLYKKLNDAINHQNYEQGIKYRNRIKRLEYLIQEKIFRYDEPLIFVSNQEVSESLCQVLSQFFPNLKKIERIEAIDISNFQEKQAVGSLVTYIRGLPVKSEYRRFKIKKDGNSDFDRMKEVVERRFSQNKSLPDLLIVDGGKPQLRTVQEVLESLNIAIPVIGIAKGPDRLVVGHEAKTIRLPLNHKGFNLVRAVRDESHRFAKKYHLLLRSKSYKL